MSAHLVKCKYCGMQFDANKEVTVKVSNTRYAHKECADKYASSISAEEQAYNELEKYIKKILKIDTINAKIKKQIRDYRQEYNYSYSGMMKTLHWWYEIKGHTTELAQNGIGIIPYVYDDALKYYYGIFIANQINKEKGSFEPKVEVIEITPPTTKKEQIKLFKL